MPEENAGTTPEEVMRRLFDAWNRADLDTFASLFDADAEVITDPSWMEAGPFIGRAAIRKWFEGLKEAWAGRDEGVVRELIEVEGTVVARIEWQVRGRSSGIETSLDATSVNIVERGRIARQQWYFDHAEALEAAGLEE